MSPFNNAKKRQFVNVVDKDQELFSLDDELKCKYNELLTFRVETAVEVNGVEVPIADYPFQQLL